MLSPGIKFKTFTKNRPSIKLKKALKNLVNSKSEVIVSLGKNYKYSYTKKDLLKFKNKTNFRIIGMGGSSLGSQAIYDFLKNKIKKNFLFVNNLTPIRRNKKKNLQTLLFQNLGIQ